MTPRAAARRLRQEGLDATAHTDGRLTLGLARTEPGDGWIDYLRRRLATIPGAVEHIWRYWHADGRWHYQIDARIG